jgi:preprotein translocase subunit SecD
VATAALDSPTSVRLTLTTNGVAGLNKLAAQYYGRQVATEVAGVVINQPTINAPTFGDTMIVSEQSPEGARALVTAFGGNVTVPPTTPPGPGG